MRRWFTVFFHSKSGAANAIVICGQHTTEENVQYSLAMSLRAATTVLRLRATASFARTCPRSTLQQQQKSRSLFSASALSSKLDKLLPQVEDFPSRHIGPRRHDAKEMLRILGFNVSTRDTGEDMGAQGLARGSACELFEFTQPMAYISAPAS